MSRVLLLSAALHACAAVEGDVLIARDAGTQPPVPMDASTDPASMDSGTDAASALTDPNTRGACRIGGAADGFYENFSADTLAGDTWLVAHGPVTFAQASARGGFARDNVQVLGGSLRLRVRGDLYDGDVRSIDANGRPLANGKRSGAAVATRNQFGSGTYQVQGLFAAPPGVEVALWFVRDDDSRGAIDLATPGRDGTQRSYSRVHMRTRDASNVSENQFALPQRLDDGASHILRFDWYTTNASSVNFWIDDEARWKSARALPPTAAGRLWIVAWVPDDAVAEFDTAEIRIENAFVTPFGNDGDVCSDGELVGPSLAIY